jgi:hypothetical protein
MPCNYLYLDDDKSGLDSYIRAVSAEGELTIEHKFPGPFDEELERLRLRLPNFDGLILDWRLDEKTNDNRRATFRAAALAQELRTRGTERELKELPIVLWSTYRKMVHSYTGDNTSQDLFDSVWDKERVVDEAPDVRRKLISLANAYGRIQEYRGVRFPIAMMLGLESADVDQLDPRISERFPDVRGTAAHDLARFLLRSVVVPTGPLIDREHLAARLGIEIESSPGWPDLTQVLTEYAGYTGVFSEGWLRWWNWKLERWWHGTTGASPLGMITATERIDLLRDALHLDLAPAPAIAESYSTVYWTICQGYRTPLDPVNGYALNLVPREPWLEPDYISELAALERIIEFQLDPLEEPRFKILIDSLDQ